MRILELLGLAVLTVGPISAAAQDARPVEILSPAPGAILSGVVEVRGTASGANFLSANLAFAYDSGSAEQWFPIVDMAQPAADVQIALWDTGAISDGDYVLRLRMNGTDGTVQDAVVPVQVRNYTAAPTAVPTATLTAQPTVRIPTPVVLAPAPTAVRDPAETPTALPPNPARLTRGDLFGGLARGAIAVLAIALLWGAVLLRRRL